MILFWQSISINQHSSETGASNGLPMGNPGRDAANVGSKHFQGCGADAHARRLKAKIVAIKESNLCKANYLFQRGISVVPGWLVPPMCGTSWACQPRRLPSLRTRSSMRTKRRKRKRKIQGCFKDQRGCTGLVLLDPPCYNTIIQIWYQH